MAHDATPVPRDSTGRIELHDVGVTLDRTVALDQVNVHVAPGAWLGIIGANGAGKSTLLRAVARLVAYSGTVRIDGRDTRSMGRREFAQTVAYVSQDPQFPAQMRAIDYVALGRTPHHGYFGTESARDRDRSAELLRDIGLEHLSLRALDSLSGGELQRLVLARALAQEAPILLLDEATSALDLGRRVDVLELVDALRIDRRLTVISTLHDLTLAAQFAEQVLLLAGGRAVAEGPPSAVMTEETLNRYFEASVEILRSRDNNIVVVPRRREGMGNYD